MNSKLPDDRQQEIEILRRRVAELEASHLANATATYADILFENSGEAIFIIDPYTMEILDANPNAARRLDYKPEVLRQLPLDQIEMPRQIDDSDAETSWQSSASGTSFYEANYRCQNGSLIPMEVSSRLVSWQGRDVLINFVRDIRWRKEAEDALRFVNSQLEQEAQKRTAELAEEKDKLEAVLGSVVEAVAMTNPERKVVYVNQAFVRLTGYTLKEIQDLSFVELFEFSSLNRRIKAVAWDTEDIWSGEVRCICKDGRTYPTILTIVPMNDGNGRFTGYVTSHRDISHFKALDKALYSFITNVSHQLRTPLTNIKLYTQLLQGNITSDKATHYLSTLNTQTDRLAHLVQDILELASLDGSDSALDWQLVDMQKMIAQLCETNQKRAALRQQTLTCKVHETVPAIRGDMKRLQQAVKELLDNAFNFSPVGGNIFLDLVTAVKNDRHWITLAVRDEGSGIAPNEQARIFERFFRGHVSEEGHIPGTGLGLSIAQQIVQAHHGRITLKSKPGAGAAFTLWLPINVAS